METTRQLRRLVIVSSMLLAACGGASQPDSTSGSTTGSMQENPDLAPAPASPDLAPADPGASPSPSTSPMPSTSPSTSPMPSSSPSPSSAGPVILSFGTNVTSLSAGETVRFVAVVTDADGLAQLVGGHLTDASGKIQYGAFQATTQGSYQLDLNWSQLNQAEDITFKTSEMRHFVATFFDQSGRSTPGSADVELDCNGLAACSGVCKDLSKDNENCGACGSKVALPRICVGGAPGCSGSNSFCADENICTDLDSDSANCGACGVQVPPAPAGQQIYCSDGKAACLGAGDYCPGTGLCANTHDSCGTCGHQCPAEMLCLAGECNTTFTSTTRTDCTTLCQDHGYLCDSLFRGYASYKDGTSAGLSCDKTAVTTNLSYIECSCTDTP